MTAVELPDRLNAASVFVDSHLAEGRGEKTAILSGDQAVTYHELIMNGSGLLEQGSKVTLIVGNSRLEHIIVQ